MPDDDQLNRTLLANEALRRRNGELVLALQAITRDGSRLTKTAQRHIDALVNPPVGRTLHNHVSDVVRAAEAAVDRRDEDGSLMAHLRERVDAMRNYSADGQAERERMSVVKAERLEKARAARQANRGG